MKSKPQKLSTNKIERELEILIANYEKKIKILRPRAEATLEQKVTYDDKVYIYLCVIKDLIKILES